MTLDKLIEINLNFKQKNSGYFIKDLENLIGCLIDLQSTYIEAKPKLQSWKYDIDTLITKFILHSNTTLNILNGVAIESRPRNYKAKIIDVPSLYVLIRAIYENYLTIYYLYFEASESLSEFRHDCFMYAGFLKRMNLRKNIKANKQLIEKDLKSINELKVKIFNSSHFKKYNRRSQKLILEGKKPRLFNNWNDLYNRSELGEIFQNFYGSMSNYAHSEGISLLNLPTHALKYNNHNETLTLVSNWCNQLISILIFRLRRYFKSVEFKFNMYDSETRQMIEAYHNSAIHSKSS